jgi:hypothetical protein
MNSGVIAKLPSEDVRVYVVWVPMFRGRESDVPKATTEVLDTRAMHFWDGDSQLVAGYRQTLGFNEPAWDIFLLYGPQTTWEGDRPPTPEYWMHQLGSRRSPRVKGPFLDAALFLDRTRALLSRHRG